MMRHAQYSNTLTAGAAGRTMPEKTLELLPGKCAPELEIRLTLGLNNTSGGAITLTDAEKRLLLSNFACTLKIRGKEVPINNENLDVVQDLGRSLLKARPRAYSDTTDGLSKQLPDADVTTVEVGIRIPTGRNRRIRQFARNVGMGASQCKAVSLEVRQNAAVAFKAGVAIDSASFEIRPVEESCVGDPWIPLPHIVNVNQVGRDVVVPKAGLLLAILETSAVHSATTLTEFGAMVDGEVIAERTDTEANIEEFLMGNPDLPSAADLSDVATALLQLPDDVDLEQDPQSVYTGTFRLLDPTNLLATKVLRAFIVPLEEESYWKEAHKHVAAANPGKFLRSPMLYAVRGLDGRVHDRFQPYLGAVFFERGERQAEQFASLEGAVGQEPQLFTPEHAKAMIAEAKRLPAVLQERLIGQVASSAPGAVANTRGGKMGSTVRAAITRAA